MSEPLVADAGAPASGIRRLRSVASPAGGAGRGASVAGLIAAAVAATVAFPAVAETRMTVVDPTIVRRTCPSAECGGVGRFNVGESVVGYETADEWIRVSPYYTAGCHDGKAAFVQLGPTECTSANGIEGGEFAEWVKAKFLTARADSE